MKGILLAGGLGTRLSPLTSHDNKHFLPVYNKRMIEYPIHSLVEAGIDEIILVTGGKHPGRFLELLKNGHQHGIKHLYYAYQEGEGGIAEALKLARSFVGLAEPVVVILGDNYFDLSIKDHKDFFLKNLKQKGRGAMILLKRVADPQRFGIATLDNVQRRIVLLQEKPENPISNLAITGCYFFDSEVWNILPTLKPSSRGELEIVDVIKYYWKEGYLDYNIYPGYWSDMGQFESLQTVAQRLAERDLSNEPT